MHVSVLGRRSVAARCAVDDVTRAPSDDRFDAMREDASRCTKLSVRYYSRTISVALLCLASQYTLSV